MVNKTLPRLNDICYVFINHSGLEGMMNNTEVVAGIVGELNETERAVDQAIAHATGMVQAMIAGRTALSLSPIAAAESHATPSWPATRNWPRTTAVWAGAPTPSVSWTSLRKPNLHVRRAPACAQYKSL
jgi:hypothetical protein